MVKKAAFWSDAVYTDLWDRLRRPAPTLHVTWSGTYVTFNTRERSAPTVAGGEAINADPAQESQAVAPQQVCYHSPPFGTVWEL
jgi:hypothetical protein